MRRRPHARDAISVVSYPANYYHWGPWKVFTKEMLARHAQEEKAQMLREVESDSNKLLKLASELDSEISQSDRDSLTKDEAKKLAEIGKIARKILKKLAKLARRF